MLRDRMLYEKKHNIKYVVVNIKHIGPWELEIIMQKYHCMRKCDYELFSSAYIIVDLY